MGLEPWGSVQLEPSLRIVAVRLAHEWLIVAILMLAALVGLGKTTTA